MSNDDQLEIEVNGVTLPARKGQMLIEATDAAGIYIPRFCYHPKLSVAANCRMCLVEDEKTGRLMASCVTPAASDMVLQTASPRIIKHRRNIARLMIAEHPESCILCSKGNHCRLRWVAAQLGVGETSLYHMPNYKPYEEANPFIIRDLSKCILCGKCIRADHELVAVGAIDYNMRGFKSRPATAHELGLEQSSCTFCGTCVSMCPTGALSAKNTRYVSGPEQESISICGFCSVGCSLAMGVADNRIVEVNPAQLPQSVNGATLCVRGHFAHDFLNSPRRLIGPMGRKDGNRENDELVPISWDSAFELIAHRLMAIKSAYGPQSVGFLGSSKCTNEENYLFQKIARVLMGTNNIDNGGYLSGQSLLKVFDEKTSGGYRKNRLADLEKAEVILILGADPGHSVPVVGYYLKRAARQGIPLIVVDPRRTELAEKAKYWLQIRPGTDGALALAFLNVIITEELFDEDFVTKWTRGFGDLTAHVQSFTPEKTSQITWVPAGLIRESANVRAMDCSFASMILYFL